MSLTIQELPTSETGVYKFALEGRLDETTSRDFEKKLEPALQKNPTTLILDMARLDFISSAGIKILIDAQKRLSAQNGTVLLVDLQPQIRKVLEIIKALPGITVFRDVQELDNYLALMQRKVKEEKGGAG
jgi:anti-sigma B factor antagonist